MKKLMFISLLIIFLSVNFVYAQKPPYYSKKSTWFETMLSSLEQLKKYQERMETQRKYKLGEWFVIGPFQIEGKKAHEESFPPEKEIALDQNYNDGKLKWENRPDWKDGNVNYFKQVDKASTYLYRVITLKQDFTLPVYLGSDDGIKVWLNGNLLLDHYIDRGCEPNQESVNLKLKKGENKFLMKITNGNGDYAYYFSADKANPVKQIWNLIEKEFNKDELLQQMEWERQDQIWIEWKGDAIAEIGKRYADAYRQSCEWRNVDPEIVLPDIKTIADLKKIRNIYIDSRMNEKIILTPKPPKEPRINGPKLFGVRPGHPFLFTIPATGERPMEFSVENLPEGLVLDKLTGQITGTLFRKMEYDVIYTVKNSLGSDKKKFKIIVGDKIALTPPLGWNSWNCFANAVDDQKVRSAADAMVNSGLINHGWTYINIDDCWEIKPDSKDPMLMGDPRDATGMININKKFPNMKALGDYIHSKGLKMGIYSSPGPLTCAGFTASYEFEEKDAQQYANWGIDYLKYDWCSYGRIAKDQSLPELKKPYFVMRGALDKVNRDIVYSLCQYGMGKVWEWGAEVGGNCWRTTGDIVDTWESMSTIGFSQDGNEKFAKQGNWNDPDMLVVGQVGWGPQLHPTRLRPNEQYTHISLWCLLSSPLLIGCDMTQMDDFTINLLTNDEVIAINQDALGKPAGRIKKEGNIQIWARDLEDGSKAVGIFNLGEKREETILSWNDLGIFGKYVIRDLWKQKDISIFDSEFKTKVAPHGVVLIKLSASK